MDIARLEDRMARWPRLADRLFTAAEQEYCRGRPTPPQHFAARVAAKEAAFKALGEGWPALKWTEIEVASAGGKPTLVLRGKAAELAAGGTPVVSLSHDAGMAVAAVLLVDR